MSSSRGAKIEEIETKVSDTMNGNENGEGSKVTAKQEMERLEKDLVKFSKERNEIQEKLRSLKDSVVLAYFEDSKNVTAQKNMKELIGLYFKLESSDINLLNTVGSINDILNKSNNSLAKMLQDNNIDIETGKPKE
jgi:hypothetical protein